MQEKQATLLKAAYNTAILNRLQYMQKQAGPVPDWYRQLQTMPSRIQRSYFNLFPGLRPTLDQIVDPRQIDRVANDARSYINGMDAWTADSLGTSLGLNSGYSMRNPGMLRRGAPPSQPGFNANILDRAEVPNAPASGKVLLNDLLGKDTASAVGGAAQSTRANPAAITNFANDAELDAAVRRIENAAGKKIHTLGSRIYSPGIRGTLSRIKDLGLGNHAAAKAMSELALEEAGIQGAAADQVRRALDLGNIRRSGTFLGRSMNNVMGAGRRIVDWTSPLFRNAVVPRGSSAVRALKRLGSLGALGTLLYGGYAAMNGLSKGIGDRIGENYGKMRYDLYGGGRYDHHTYD